MCLNRPVRSLPHEEFNKLLLTKEVSILSSNMFVTRMLGTDGQQFRETSSCVDLKTSHKWQRVDFFVLPILAEEPGLHCARTFLEYFDRPYLAYSTELLAN